MEGALSNGRAVVSRYFFRCCPQCRVQSIASRLSYLAYTPKTRTENCLRRTLLFPPIPGLL